MVFFLYLKKKAFYADLLAITHLYLDAAFLVRISYKTRIMTTIIDDDDDDPSNISCSNLLWLWVWSVIIGIF